MLDTIKNVLKIIESHGFEAYIVGGFVRDFILGNSSKDVDICTNAKPFELNKIFDNVVFIDERYGTITVEYNKIKFEITTFRKDNNYMNNRKPESIEYIDSLDDDIQRRDFTMNALCMDSSLKIIDKVGGLSDIKNGLIRTIKNPYKVLEEDALRILRAIRFATTLNFILDSDLEKAIIKYKELLKNISYYRKKDELNKILLSKDSKRGVSLIKKYGLDLELDIYNIDNIISSDDLIYIWSSFEFSLQYPFKKDEKKMIETIKSLCNCNNLDNMVLYKYGLYANVGSALIKKIDKNLIIEKYNSLPIKSRSDILISNEEIKVLLGKNNYNKISIIYNDLEENILNYKLKNDYSDIRKYIISRYLGENNEK